MEKIEELNGTVCYDDQEYDPSNYLPSGVSRLPGELAPAIPSATPSLLPPADIFPAAPPPGLSWLSKLVGDDVLVNVTHVDLRGVEDGDAALEFLKGLTQLQNWSSSTPRLPTPG